jgi:formate hydrogenlyase transcriptional activator
VGLLNSGILESTTSSGAFAPISDSPHARFNVATRLVPPEGGAKNAATSPESGDSASVFRLVAEALPHGVVLIGSDGVITLVNQTLERLFGYSRKELIGQSIDVLFRDFRQAASEEYASGSFSDPPVELRPVEAALRLLARRSDGFEFPVEIHLNPVSNEKAAHLLVTVVEIAEGQTTVNKLRPSVQDQVHFVPLVADLTEQFINLPVEQLDHAIRDGLRRICETLDVDRCAFDRIHANGSPDRVLSWERPGIPPHSVPTLNGFPWTLETVLAGKVAVFSTSDQIPSPVDRATYEQTGTRSSVMVPLSVAGKVAGVIGFHRVRRERAWELETLQRVRVVASVFGNILARRQRDEAIAGALAEVKQLRDRLQDKDVYFRPEVPGVPGVDEQLGTNRIVGKSAAIRLVLEQVKQVASTDSTVLLLGETGTGKELFATQVHELSARRGAAMVRVNCSAIPSALIESELFGREKGAFTGALSRQAGRFELADRSSIFLDEIGDLPLEVQVKLLRVLEERQIERLGSPKPIRVDTRIIAATHRDLEQRITDGTFREDLFYRMNVFPIRVPPLRDRVEDIPLLIWRFVGEFSKAFGKRIDAISPENMAALQRYPWPGNIRELRNIVERAMIVATGPHLTITPPMASVPAATRSTKLIEVETDHIRSVLESTAWRIRGLGGAADRLGLKPTTLETRMAKLGLRRPKPA